MTRRDFLASLAALAFATEDKVIRVGHVASDERALRGAQLGAEEQLNSRFESRFGAPMESLAWASWMAVKIAAELALRAMPLERLRFDGHKGEPLWFRPEDHFLRQPLYVVAGEKVVAEVEP